MNILNNALVIGLIGCVIGLAAGYVTASKYAQSPSMASMTSDSSHSSVTPTMQHATLAVDASKPIPSVAIEALPDSKDGYNIRISTTNFAFTPEKVGAAPIANEGHAHLFINGTKIARVYGPWFYTGSSLFKSGDNTVEVTLNANDHSEWVVGDTHIAAKIVVKK